MMDNSQNGVLPMLYLLLTLLNENKNCSARPKTLHIQSDRIRDAHDR